MRKLSLKTIIIYYSIVIFIIPLIVVSVFSIYIFYDNYTKEILNKNTLLINNLALRIEDFLNLNDKDVSFEDIGNYYSSINNPKMVYLL